MSHYLWALKPYYRQVAGQLLLGSLAGIAMNTAVVLPAVFLGRAIDAATLFARGELTRAALVQALLLFIAATLATELPRVGKRWWLMTANARIRANLRADALRGVMAWPMSTLAAASVGDIMARVVGDIEVLGVGVREVVSVLCRMIFDFAVWSPRPVKVPILLVCEEAHRYAPRSDAAAFQPTKQALARIAKEGRKYGVSLGLVSQRPSELAETILSQCNTIIALRMSNEQDQNFVQRALPDAVRSLVDVLPTLRAQEALIVGEGTAVPVRVRFSDLAEDRRPHSADVPFATLWKEDTADADYVVDIVRRWRHQERSVVGK